MELYNIGQAGEVYNIGSGEEVSNLDLVKNVLTVLEKPFSLIKHVADRPGHDFRYSIDCSKFLSAVKGFNFTQFDEGLQQTIRWYRDRA